MQNYKVCGDQTQKWRINFLKTSNLEKISNSNVFSNSTLTIKGTIHQAKFILESTITLPHLH